MSSLNDPLQPRVIHIAPTLHPRAGGPSRVVADLSCELAGLNEFGVHLVSQSLPGEPVVGPEHASVQRHVQSTSSRTALQLGLPVWKQLARVTAGDRSTIIHSHGLWTLANHWAVRRAQKVGAPLVIQPHGMLQPWALRHKAYKKRAALALFQWRDLLCANVLIATSPSEQQEIRAMGLRQPIALVPNGISPAPALPAARAETAHPGPRTVLFMSRIHPVKGLINLVQAWGVLRPRDWRLVIAGPDENGHLAAVMQAAREARVEDSVSYIGEVHESGKPATLTSADLFVLPSFSENFGVVVAEAMSYGVPVITTRAAPWADLEAFRCGWWIEVGVEPLVRALRSATSLSDAERREMGARATNYVNRYQWPFIAQQMASVYRWLLNMDPKPAHVYLD